MTRRSSRSSIARSPDPFFVKNLENIQGDERDVIFLSVTYAKAADGVLRYNFGALNGENGWRRLNVLTTRARRRMRVFSSIRGSDINPPRRCPRGRACCVSFSTTPSTAGWPCPLERALAPRSRRSSAR